MSTFCCPLLLDTACPFRYVSQTLAEPGLLHRCIASIYGNHYKIDLASAYHSQGREKTNQGFMDWYIGLTHAACCSAQLLSLARDSRMGKWLPVQLKDQLTALCKGNCHVPPFQQGSWRDWYRARQRDKFGFTSFLVDGDLPNLLSMPLSMELEKAPANAFLYRASNVEDLMHALSTGMHQCMVARKKNFHFVARRKRDREGDDEAASPAGQQSS